MMTGNQGRLSAIPPTSRYALDDYRKKDRPSTMESFPDRKSRNPFFIRNNPHPSKVRHIKGLLDFPVCTVYGGSGRDEGQARQKPTFHWPNLTMRKEKFVPGIGIVNMQPQWFEELQNFTQQAGLKSNQLINLSPFQEVKDNLSNGAPPSRLSSRQSNTSRVGSRASRASTRSGHARKSRDAENDFVRKSVSSNGVINNNQDNKNGICDSEVMTALKEDLAGKHAVCVDDKESYVFHLLTKILQTSSHEDIKQWLMQAPNQEKETVLDMVRAISNKDYNDMQQQEEGAVDVLRIGKPSPNDYATNFLYHESSLDPEVYQRWKGSSPTNPILEQLNESVDNDIDQNTRTTSQQCNYQLENFLPRISPQDAEIEEIRSRLVSRSSINVFGTNCK